MSEVTINYGLQKINWERLGQDTPATVRVNFDEYENEVVRIKPELSRANKIAKEYVEQAMNDCMSVLGLWHSIDVGIMPYDNAQPQKVLFLPSKNDSSPHRIIFSKEFYTQVITALHGLNDELKDPHVLKKNLRVLPELLAAVAHEMCHFRQKEQDQDYFVESVQANSAVSNFIKGNDISSIADIPKEVAEKYSKDLGERSARAFAIRYLREKGKTFDESSDLHRAFLLQEEIEINKLKAFMQNEFV